MSTASSPIKENIQANAPTLQYEQVQEAARFLGANTVSKASYEGVVAAYTGPSRNYHGIEHATRMALGTNAISKIEGSSAAETWDLIFPSAVEKKAAESRRKLIGFGHDIVHFGVVGDGVPEIARKALPDYLEFDPANPTTFTVKKLEDVPQDKRVVFELAQIMFANESGKVFDSKNQAASKGLSEFASALVKMDMLQEAGLPPKELAVVALGTALTIPFVQGKNGGAFIDTLNNKLDELDRKFSLRLTPTEKDQVAALAVDISIQDVLNFAGDMKGTPEERLKAFLGGSWRLMTETNVALRDPEHMTTEQFMSSLKGTRGFARAWLDPNVAALNPDTIFEQTAITLPTGQQISYPDAATNKTLRNNIDEVLTNTASYLDVKMTSAGLVLALARKAGEDVANKPLTELMKGIGTSIQLPRTMVSTLDIPVNEKPVLAALEGRSRDQQIQFDTDRSPIGEFLYNKVSPFSTGTKTRLEALRVLGDAAANLLDKKITPDEYLVQVEKSIGKDNVRMISQAISEAMRKSDPAAGQRISENSVVRGDIIKS